jgi:Tol biopolymer transport system component
VHDRKTGKTKLVSKTSGGDPNTDTADSPAISPSGRYVGFTSDDDNFPGANGVADVYVHDRKTGNTRLVSQTSDGDPADGASGAASISESGRYVAFSSSADNLPGNDSFQDVYVNDRKTGETTLVSRQGLIAANGISNQPSISASGSRVAFRSEAPNLPGDDTTYNIYTHHVSSATTSLTSSTSNGEPADGLCTGASISSSGRYVAFDGHADNLPGTDGIGDVYVHDRKTGKTKLISQTSAGDPAEFGGSEAAIAADGGFVAFTSAGDNLPGDDTANDVFIRGPVG